MSLLRSTLLVSLASAASRILGFARDVLFAQVLGAGPVADAFLAAFRLPNLLRRVLGEGGLNPALMPILARLGPEDGARFAGEALCGLALVLLAFTALVEVFAGVAVLVIAPGLAEDPETANLAALYTRLAFPLVVGVTLASFVAAVLNHRRRFRAAAIAPLIVNAALIAALLWLRGSTLPEHAQAWWLAAATSLSGFAQLALVGGALVRRGDAALHLSPPRWSPAVASLVSAAGPTLLAGAAMQLFVLVGTQAASYLPGGLSFLYYADRVAQLPLGIIASAAGIVLLPELAGHLVAGNRAAVLARQNRALDMALLIALPAAVALACLAGPIASVLFERGAFGPDDSAATAAALAGLSCALPAAGVAKVLSQTLFAEGRSRAVLASVAVGIAATAAGAFGLAPTFGLFGIGLGIALGCAAQALCLVLALRRRGLWAPDGVLWARLFRVALASALLGAALVLGTRWLPNTAPGLAGLCFGGLAVYAAAAWLLGAVRPSDLAALAKKA